MATKMLTAAKQEEMEAVIVKKLLSSKSKNAIKEIANEVKVDQSYVRNIYNKYNIGQKRKNVANTSTIMIQQSS